MPGEEMDSDLLSQFQTTSEQASRKIYLPDLKRLSKIVKRKTSGQRAAQGFSHFITLRLVRHLGLQPARCHSPVANKQDKPEDKAVHSAGSVKPLRKWSGGAALTEMAIRNLMQGEGLRPRIHFAKADTLYPLQSNMVQVIWVVSGSMTIQFPPEQEFLTLSTGDRLDLPAGTLGHLKAEEEGVIYLQAATRPNAR